MAGLRSEVHLATPVDGALADAWSRLARSSSCGIFATPEWHHAMEAGQPRGTRVRVIAVRDGSHVVGVGPMRVVRRRLVRTAGLLAMGELGYGYADYGGLIAAPGCERPVAEAVVGALLRQRGWDCLDLQQVPEGTGAQELQGALAGAGLATLVHEQNLCPCIDLRTTWDGYLATLSPSAREWLQRKPRKLARELSAGVESVPAGEVLAELATLRRFHRLRPRSVVSQARERQFARMMEVWLEAAQRRGWLRMLRLRARGRTLAVLLGYEYERVFYFQSSAYDPDPQLNRYSLGASLLAAAIRGAFEQGLERFDLLRGDYRYKHHLGARPRANLRIVAVPSPLLARALLLAMRRRARGLGQSPWVRLPPASGSGRRETMTGS